MERLLHLLPSFVPKLCFIETAHGLVVQNWTLFNLFDQIYLVHFLTFLLLAVQYSKWRFIVDVSTIYYYFIYLLKCCMALNCIWQFLSK